MKRHTPHHLPKHVRELKDALARIGAAAIRITLGRRYALAWSYAGVPMTLGGARSASGNAFEGAWKAVRRLFRQHHLVVPA